MSVVLFSLVVNVIWWFWYFFHLDEKDVTIVSYLCSAYVVIVVVFLIGDWIPLFISTQPGDPWSSVGVSYLTCYSYLMASCILCMTVISTRCASIDASILLTINGPPMRNNDFSVHKGFSNLIKHISKEYVNIVPLASDSTIR